MSITRRSLLLGVGGAAAATVVPRAAFGSNSGRDFFVDPAGRDSADGRTRRTAWASLARVNAARLQPGDAVYLKRDAVFAEELIIPASGSRGNPILFSAYGKGRPPTIYGADPAKGWKPVGSCWMKRMDRMPGIVLEDGRPMRWVRWRDNLQATEAELRPGRFTYNPETRTVYMKPSTGRPRRHSYAVSQRRHGIIGEGRNHITIRGIAVLGFARHGIVAVNAAGWLVEDNIVRLGGGFWEPQNTYLGNGIEFSADCHDCTARDNVVKDIFDSGLTTQTYPGGPGRPSNIVFEGNRIRQCGLAGIEIALYHHGDRLAQCATRGNRIKRTGLGWSGLGDGTTGGHAIYIYTMSETPLTLMSGISISRNRISENVGDGVYILNNCGNVAVSDNLISANLGRGIYYKLYEDTGGGLDATGNTVSRNKQSGIHFESYFGSCLIASNSFYRNGHERDGRNGGRGTHNIYVHEYVRAGITFENNIVHAIESAALWTSDSQSDSGSRAQHNCYHRSAGPIAMCAGRRYTVETFKEALGDMGTSIASDPHYVDAEQDNCALRPVSPCIAAGREGADMGARIKWV